MSSAIMNNKKTINAWAIFDWANSAYALVISTAIFPVYFIKYTPEEISLGPLNFSNSSLYSFAVSFSYIIIACLSPLLSGMADFSGRRKFFLKLFTLIGSIACTALYFFKGEPQLWLGTSAFILATIGFAGSIVFYDSYLPLIVTEDRYNKVSAKGYTYGYIGSVLLLIVILLMVQKPDWFGISDGQMGSRLGFALVGLWWIGFAQYSFKHLPKDTVTKFTSSMVKNGYKEISSAFTKVKASANIKSFLLAFFFYSAGVQTVIYLAAIFAEKELGFETAELILLILLLQLVAIGGAYFFSILGNKKGNKFSILCMIVIWILICVGAFFTYDKLVFYLLASLVGIVMGGIQSLSRASYSMLLPEKDHDTTSYFSFYDVVYKSAIVGGTFLFGVVDNITNNMRYSVLALAFCFVAGFYFMWRTTITSKIPKEEKV
ncbi:MAG TPA: MFS transporter [Saprospiraceae bacterium]|nr:MFS transporter [Saprospiraceae bacterium]